MVSRSERNRDVGGGGAGGSQAFSPQASRQRSHLSQYLKLHAAAEAPPHSDPASLRPCQWPDPPGFHRSREPDASAHLRIPKLLGNLIELFGGS